MIRTAVRPSHPPSCLQLATKTDVQGKEGGNEAKTNNAEAVCHYIPIPTCQQSVAEVLPDLQGCIGRPPFYVSSWTAFCLSHSTPIANTQLVSVLPPHLSSIRESPNQHSLYPLGSLSSASLICCEPHQKQHSLFRLPWRTPTAGVQRLCVQWLLV